MIANSNEREEDKKRITKKIVSISLGLGEA